MNGPKSTEESERLLRDLSKMFDDPATEERVTQLHVAIIKAMKQNGDHEGMVTLEALARVIAQQIGTAPDDSGLGMLQYVYFRALHHVPEMVRRGLTADHVVIKNFPGDAQ